MVFTKTWSSVLALLASAFLAGMFLLSLGASQAFSRADETGLRAMAQAGIAAIAAEVRASPARAAPSFMRDPRMVRLLNGYDEKLTSLDVAKLDSGFRKLVNEVLVADQPQMSIALIDADDVLISRTGISDRAFDELVRWPSFLAALERDGEISLAATVAGHLHAIEITRKGKAGRRLIALQPVDVGGASSLRQVLGTAYRAGFVRKGEVIGEPIGGATPKELVLAVETATRNDKIPATGTSGVFDVGDGADRRLAVVGRVSGLTGPDDTPTQFVVLTQHTAGFSQKDLAQRLVEAANAGFLGQLNWILLGTLLGFGVALSIYLPHNEVIVPLRRLQAEFEALARGQQRQLFHDSYTGEYAALARSASAALQSLRMQWEDEFDIAFDVEHESTVPDDESSTGKQRRISGRHDTRSLRKARRAATGALPSRRGRARSASIELPEASGNIEFQSNLPGAEQSTGASSQADAAPSEHAPVDSPGPKSHDDALPQGQSIGLGEASDSASRLASLTAAETGGASLSGSRAPAGSGSAPTLTDEVPDGQQSTSLLTPSDYRAPAPDVGSAGYPLLSDGDTNGIRDSQNHTVAAFPPAPPVDERDPYFREIYDRFVQTKVACGESTESVTYEKFAAKLAKNIDDLQRRDDVKDVQFSVYVKDGKAALKAKVVRA